MRHKNLDLLIALEIAVINVIWALLSMLVDLTFLSVVNIILALPLVFVVPGYTLTETLFQRRSLEIVQRLAFTLALSLTVTIVSGFLLNLFPAGLAVLPWALWLGLFSTIFTLLAYLRRRRQPAEEARADETQVVPIPRSRVQIPPIALFSLAILIVVLSIVYSVVGAEQQSRAGFTNLSILPATSGNTCAVTIRVQSFELAPTSYRVVVSTNKTLTATWNIVSLEPQQQWTQPEAIPVGTNTSLLVLIQLYRSEQPQTVYRHVYVTLHVVATQGNTTKQCTSA